MERVSTRQSPRQGRWRGCRCQWSEGRSSRVGDRDLGLAPDLGAIGPKSGARTDERARRTLSRHGAWHLGVQPDDLKPSSICCPPPPYVPSVRPARGVSRPDEGQPAGHDESGTGHAHEDDDVRLLCAAARRRRQPKVVAEMRRLARPEASRPAEPGEKRTPESDLRSATDVLTERRGDDRACARSEPRRRRPLRHLAMLGSPTPSRRRGPATSPPSPTPAVTSTDGPTASPPGPTATSGSPAASTTGSGASPPPASSPPSPTPAAPPRPTAR